MQSGADPKSETGATFMERSGATQPMKRDYKRELKELYGPRRGDPAIVDVPELSFLMVDGIGDPNTSRDYKEAVGPSSPSPTA